MGGGVDMWANTIGLTVFGTLRHGKSDAKATGKAKDHKVIDYPKPDGVLSFDRLTNVAYSFTNHDENQPAHLRLKDPSVPIRVNLPDYAEPAQRYCPAGCMRCWAKARMPSSGSTSRTASTARPATSRTPARTSSGPPRWVQAGRTIPTCRARNFR